jgi:hypothetical protein
MSLPNVKGRRITSLRETNERKKGPRWVEDEDGCVIAQWSISPTGYPPLGTRQAMYIFAKGPYPRGSQLHHHCGQKACLNPDHQIPLSRMQHAGLHAILRRRDWMDLPVPERIALSRSIIEGELVRT